MLGSCKHARLRAAHKALNEGRLDDAFACATASGALDDAHPHAVRDALAAALLARARLHAQAGRYESALNDLEKHEVIGGSTDARAALRDRVLAEQRELLKRNERDRDAERRAAVKLQEGRLDSLRDAADQIANADRRAPFVDELDARERRADRLLEQARAALAAGNALAAHRYYRDAVARCGRSSEIDAVADELAPRLRAALLDAYDRGDVVELSHALDADDAALGLDGLRQSSQWMRRAAELLRARDYPNLKQTLLRLKGWRPAPWLDAVIAVAAQAIDAHDQLVASPLGVLAADVSAAATTYAASRPEDVDLRAPAARLDAALLLIVEGACSALLLRKRSVTIGRAGSSCDIPLPTDARSCHAEIERRGDDDFLSARYAVQVNRREVWETMLRDGDRVRIGERAKFVYRRPSAKSGTAVLELAETCRLAQDVSRIVLFRDTCLIGAGSSRHLRTKDADARLVLFESSGTLLAKAEGDRRATPALLNETLEAGGVVLTVKEYI